MKQGQLSTARWIWSESAGDSLNSWVMFRKRLPLEPGNAGTRRTLAMAADARYHLWVNGQWIGEGPARSWPDELFADTYDLSELLEGTDSLELQILVHHFTPGTSNYIVGEPGCAVELVETHRNSKQILLQSDASWECAVHPGYQETVVKISNGLGYGEVYRADLAADAAAWCWSPAYDKGLAIGESRDIIARDIPHLEEHRIEPAGITGSRCITSLGFSRSVNLRPLVYPGTHDINKHKRFSGILEVGIRLPEEGSCEIGLTFDPHDTLPVVFFVGEKRFVHENGRRFPLTLPEGVITLKLLLSGEYHDPVFHLHFLLPEGADLVSPQGEETEEPFTFTGPFNPQSHLQVSEPIPDADEESMSEEELLSVGDGPVLQVPAFCVSSHHVALEYLTSREVDVPDTEFYRRGTIEQVKLPLKAAWLPGVRKEILWDLGRETSGFLEFEVDCAQGTRIDFFCFESMHDGFIEHTWSLNNSFRYIASEGEQHCISFNRRGFRYVAMVLDRGLGSAEIKSLSVRERLYPHTATAGSFSSSDEQLDAIWEISARTVSLCMEDTFVDCPAYEQTYWTGDARNTALYSYYLYDAAPLFLRGARLAARSLERSPLIESMAPSAWQNVIPAWSFFHVLAGVEYGFYSGDDAGMRVLFPSLIKNMEHAAQRRLIMPDGNRLFAMHAWNMLDWAPMDVPDDGIIAHQNALFVIAAKALAKAAVALGFGQEAELLTQWAAEVSTAVTAWFWDEGREAFCDSLSRDFIPSRTCSVQTQMFIYLADIVDTTKAELLKKKILDPPEGFVRIGSPFNQHFFLELLLRWGYKERIMEEIRTVWGNMLDHGATSCWEGWALIPGHHTRSHCHAWSAAPVFFIPSIILGIYPTGKAFSKVRIEPYPAGLTSAEGSITTPEGNLFVSWEIEEKAFHLRVVKPAGITVSVKIPEGFQPGNISISDLA